MFHVEQKWICEPACLGSPFDRSIFFQRSIGWKMFHVEHASWTEAVFGRLLRTEIQEPSALPY
jgi:hypothetical protein